MRRQPVITIAGSDRLLLGLATVAVWLSFAAVAAADDAGSLARQVPADVGLFVELRQTEDLLLPLTEPQVWLTLAELIGQPAGLAETELWRRRVERTVGMSPEEAIRTLFSQRVAFVGEGLRQTQDAVVLCRPRGDRRALIRGWRARPLPTSERASIYRLPYNIGLAHYEDLFIFGDAATHGMFQRVVDHVTHPGSPRLADDPTYRTLLSRVPPRPDGIFFARLAGPTASTAPAATQPDHARPELPGLLRGSENVLLALHRAGRLLRISAVGDAPGSLPVANGSLAELVGSLPASTLATWAGHVDYGRLPQLITGLPERSLFRVAFQLLEKSGTVQQVTGALDAMTCLAVGAVMPTARSVPAPPIPALAILVGTRDADTVKQEWGSLLHNGVALYKLLSLKFVPRPPRLPIEQAVVAGIEIERLDLSELLTDGPARDLLGELHLSWALDGDVLIIASHADWLRQILAARHARAPRLAGVLALTGRPPAEQQRNIFVAQSGAIADLGSFWHRYFEASVPQILNEDWWRDYQPRGRKIQLGLQVTPVPEHRRLRVRSVTPGLPAAGIIQAGDEILGCNRRRFATSQPIAEIQRGLEERPAARWFDVYVERDRIVRVRRIPMPFVDPIEVLRRVIGIGKVVQRVVYFDDVPDVAGSRGYLTLELREGSRPLFKFPAPAAPLPATSQPR